MYFEKESLQNNIGDDLDKRNRNFEKIESDITMMATNKITNGDFSNGTTGWGVMNSTLSTTNNTMSITGVGGGGDTNSRMSQSISIAPVIGKKIYVAFDAHKPTRHPGILKLFDIELNSMQQSLAPSTCMIDNGRSLSMNE